jgi:hypothetical protein
MLALQPCVGVFDKTLEQRKGKAVGDCRHTQNRLNRESENARLAAGGES